MKETALLTALLVCLSSLAGCSAKSAEAPIALSERVAAPEISGGAGWLNTGAPLLLEDLRGKIVLLDFWTFCCINCMHIIPELKKLEASYPRELVVIGVHSAKFANEKESKNIREAVLRYGVEHPVVNDASFKIWRAYAVNAWPTLILIDPDGRIAGRWSGEGHYDALAKAIDALIATYDRQGKINRKPLNLRLEKDSVANTALSFPGKILAEAATRRLFIADTGHNRIVVAGTDGKLIDIIGSGKEGRANGSFAESSFRHPQGLALRDGKLYVADTDNHLIRVADLSKRKVATLAGTGQLGYFKGGDGQPLKTPLNSPWDLVFVDDKLYIAMAGAHQIWIFDHAKNKIAPFAGSGQEEIIDAPLPLAALAQPSGITTDGKRLYFADSEVSAVRKADSDEGGNVYTVVGEGLFDFGDKDGTSTQVRLQHPLGVLWLRSKIYVADSYNHKIKIIDPDKLSCKTFLGTGKPGLTDGKTPQFSEPGGLTAIGSTLYIADTNNHAVRVANLDSGEVSTLKIAGLAPPSVSGEVAASSPATSDDLENGPNVETVSVPAVSVKPGSAGKLIVDLSLPRGFHLNSDASLTYRLIPVPGTTLQTDPANRSGTIKPPRLPLEIPIFTGSKEGTATLKLSLTVYYCNDDASICKIKSLLFSVPVSVARGAESTRARISYEIRD